MTATDNATTPLLDEFEIATLNEARAILSRVHDDAMRRSWDAKAAASYPEPSAADFGRVAAKADTAGDAVFDVLNSMNAYGVQPLTEGQLHYRWTPEKEEVTSTS